MRKTHALLMSLLLGLILVWSIVFQSQYSAHLKISFLDVGQGDASLISVGNTQVLIDGGPGSAILAELGKEMPVTDNEIEYMILTHPDSDHLDGLIPVIDRYKIGKIYLSGVKSTKAAYSIFVEKAQTHKIPIAVSMTGEKLWLSGEDSLVFLWPGERYLGKDSTDTNSTSIVLRYCHLEKCALFTGDLEQDGQAEMLRGCPDKTLLSADILKVPHHGSVNGLGEEFLTVIKPKIGIISVGKKNGYGHPHQAVLSLMKKYEIIINRTDEEGTIRFEYRDGEFIRE
ncbi:MAG TPA: MBL fold metallo-hydrolase [bacterium]|nr:MBL fold metallo-hydrolase [bacterium]